MKTLKLGGFECYLLEEATEVGGYFICHVSTMHDANETMCAGYYENHAEHCRKLQLLREFENELGNDAQLVEFLPQPKTEKLMSHKQIEGLRNA